MTAEELVREYYFHDSVLTDMKYSGNKLVLTVELCMYMQNGYSDGDPEIKTVNVEFIGVADFKFDNRTGLEDAEILELSYENNAVKLVLFNDEISVIIFECSEVNISDLFWRSVDGGI